MTRHSPKGVDAGFSEENHLLRVGDHALLAGLLFRERDDSSALAHCPSALSLRSLRLRHTTGHVSPRPQQPALPSLSPSNESSPRLLRQLVNVRIPRERSPRPAEEVHLFRKDSGRPLYRGSLPFGARRAYRTLPTLVKALAILVAGSTRARHPDDCATAGVPARGSASGLPWEPHYCTTTRILCQVFAAPVLLPGHSPRRYGFTRARRELYHITGNYVKYEHLNVRHPNCHRNHVASAGRG
jgi:hypothetical protein